MIMIMIMIMIMLLGQTDVTLHDIAQAIAKHITTYHKFIVN